jgi:hypothetical protein
MLEHVCARCGDYLLLFPAENIVFIEPVPNTMRFGTWLRRRREKGQKQEPVLDVRRLLSVPRPAPPEQGVTLRWRATTGPRTLQLLVDAVEEIVNCYDGDLIDVVLLPKRLRPLCDQVMRDPSGRMRLRVKPDVQLPLERLADRRLYARALLTTGPVR